MRSLVVSRMFAVLGGIGALLASWGLADEPTSNQHQATSPSAAASTDAEVWQPNSAGPEASKTVREIRELHQEVRDLRRDVNRLIAVLQGSQPETSAAKEIPVDSDRPIDGRTMESKEGWRLTLREAVRIALQNAAEMRDVGAVSQLLGNKLIVSSRNSGKNRPEVAIVASNVVSDTEEAYWKLWGAHRNLEAAMAARDGAQGIWKIAYERHIQGVGDPLEKAQADQQYFFFRSTLEQSLHEFRQREQQLRRILGLAQFDGQLIEPADEPTADAVKLDWNDAHARALADAFQLAQQREIVERCQLQLEKARQDLRTASPDLEVGNSGIEYVLPVGRRRAIARIRNLELELARAQARLQELELEVTRLLSQSLETVDATQQALKRRLDRMNTEQAELETASIMYRYGRGSLDVLLKAQREWAQSAKDYSAAIVEHAIARKDADLHRGSLLATRVLSLSP